MPMQDAVQQGAADREQLVNLINQFYTDPTRLEESRRVVDAQADQAFNAVTGQFRDAQRQSAFNASRSGLTGGTVATGQRSALQGQFGQAMSGIEAARQAQLGQQQMALQQSQLGALQQAYQQAPMQQQMLAALQAQLGGNIGAAQQQGQLNIAQQNTQLQGSQDLAQAISQPMQYLALMQQLMQTQRGQ